MSEYQYYEFRAIDRPLTKDEMQFLRTITTRAEITPTGLSNEYHWGAFKGDPHKLVEKCFDAHLYYANWGTHRLLFKVPLRTLSTEVLSQYFKGHYSGVLTTKDSQIIEFCSADDCYEDDLTDWSMDWFVPIRAGLIAGDYRALYLTWLAAVEYEDIDEDELEPPVPPGLKQLTVPLQHLADFLYLDQNMVEAAAEASPDLDALASSGDMKKWIMGMPAREKDELLVRSIESPEIAIGPELLARFHRQNGAKLPKGAAAELRTVSDILTIADQLEDNRNRKAEAAEEGPRRRR